MKIDGMQLKVLENIVFCINKILKDKSLQLLDKFQKSMKTSRWNNFLQELLENCSDKKR